MELKKIENTDIYEFKSAGKLSESTAEHLNRAFKEFKANGQKIKLLGIIDELPMPENVSFLDEIVGLKKNSTHVVDKYAILSDIDWLNKGASVISFLSPGIAVKTFDKESRAAAINWLSEEEVPQRDPEDYLANIGIEKINSHSYQIDLDHREINQASMSALYNLFEEEGKNKQLNVLVVFKSFPSFAGIKALVQGIKADLRALGTVEKYAVVSDVNFIESFAKLTDFVIPGMEIKHFSTDELKSARQWVAGD